MNPEQQYIRDVLRGKRKVESDYRTIEDTGWIIAGMTGFLLLVSLVPLSMIAMSIVAFAAEVFFDVNGWILWSDLMAAVVYFLPGTLFVAYFILPREHYLKASIITMLFMSAPVQITILWKEGMFEISSSLPLWFAMASLIMPTILCYAWEYRLEKLPIDD